MIKYLIAWGVSFFILPLTDTHVQWFTIITTVWVFVFWLNLEGSKHLRKTLLILSAVSFALCFYSLLDGGVFFYVGSKILDIRLYDYLFCAQLIITGIKNGMERRNTVHNNARRVTVGINCKDYSPI